GVGVLVSAALTLDNTGTNLSGRLMSGPGAPANLALNNANVNFFGSNLPGALTAESLGTVSLNSGASFLTSRSGGNLGATATLTIGQLSRSPGSTVTFLPGGASGTNQNLNTPFNQVLVNAFGPGVALVNGILPWA